MMILSAFLPNSSIRRILSETFDPPSSATNGLSGLFVASPRYLTSFSIRNPIADSAMFEAIPTFEA
jgi:hypothetical protein